MRIFPPRYAIATQKRKTVPDLSPMGCCQTKAKSLYRGKRYIFIYTTIRVDSPFRKWTVPVSQIPFGDGKCLETFGEKLSPESGRDDINKCQM